MKEIDWGDAVLFARNYSGEEAAEKVETIRDMWQVSFKRIRGRDATPYLFFLFDDTEKVHKLNAVKVVADYNGMQYSVEADSVLGCVMDTARAIERFAQCLK